MDPSAKARAATYFEKKLDRRKGFDLYLMCGEDPELMDEVIEELADEFREAEKFLNALYRRRGRQILELEAEVARLNVQVSCERGPRDCAKLEPNPPDVILSRCYAHQVLRAKQDLDEERELRCEAVCPDCASHIPLVESRAGTMIHQFGAMVSQCKAAKIRKLEVPL